MWQHRVLQWMPDTEVAAAETAMVQGLGDIGPERFKMRCSVCSVPRGACFKCSYRNCLASFHPLCARDAGHTMLTKPAPHGRHHHRIYCPKHGGAKLQGAKVAYPRPPAAAEDLEQLKRLRVRSDEGMEARSLERRLRAMGGGGWVGRSSWSASACCANGW